MSATITSNEGINRISSIASVKQDTSSPIVLPAENDEIVFERIRRARIDSARQAEMSIREGLYDYRKAVIWSALMTTTILMEAYDYSLMGQLFGFPEFAQKYGQQLPSGKYNIDAGTQTILKQITKVGQIVGLFFTGMLVDKFGYKWTMLGSLAAIAPITAMQFLSPNVNVLIGAQFLLGIPLAPFLTLSNVYAAEVAPLCLRPLLTSATTIGWSGGGMISTGVLRGLLNSGIHNSYRVAFAVQWAWLLPMFAIVWFAPESPMWCVKTGRTDRARAALRRLGSETESEEEVENRLALIEYTDSLEKHQAASTSYFECFKGDNLRRTEIACMVYSCINLDGYDIAGSTSYFFQRAGLSPAASFDMGLGTYGIAIVASMFTWWTMTKFGRRPLYIAGLAATVVILLIIGGLGVPEPTTAIGWATGGTCFAFKVIFYLSQGPLTYVYVAEIPSMRLRAKTVVIARGAFICSAVFMVVLTNYQINVTAWNWRGKAGFFWAGSCLLLTIWAYFRLPETKERSGAELDRLFMDKVSARKFSTTHVDAISEVEGEESEHARDKSNIPMV